MLTKIENGKRVLSDSFTEDVNLIIGDVVEKYADSETNDVMINKILNRVFYSFFEELHLPINQTEGGVKYRHLQIALNSVLVSGSRYPEITVTNTSTTYTIKFTIKPNRFGVLGDLDLNLKTENLINNNLEGTGTNDLSLSHVLELVLVSIRQVWTD